MKENRKPVWRRAHERAEKIQRDTARTMKDLRLVEFEEGDRFGRYFLRGGWTWAEVITIRGGVIVCGDVDTVCFQWLSQNPQTPRGPLYWMSGYNYSYAEQKARIGNTHGAREFDRDIASGCVLEWRRGKDISKEDARYLWTMVGESESEFMSAAYEALSDSEPLESVEVTGRCVFTAQAVLTRLVEELEARDFRASAGAWFRRAA
ncbi:MAG TPA: hypothetical protein VG734_25480 [Lacunisphaera sp.]|nr:hypothetical protein [Lacunisphaera sp.]